MPPSGLHTVVAKEVADKLASPILNRERGALYLGSTSPDIRIITRWDRQATHFFDLSNFKEQSGVAAFFEAHPGLAEFGRLESTTISFVAGYITHLVMDETWINDIYRPFFGEGSPLGGDFRANIMDRALQYSLDMEKRKDRRFVQHILREISRADLAMEIGFIDQLTISRWREIVVDITSRPPSWELFRYVARHHLGGAGIDTPETFAEFAKGLPDLVEETVNYLSQDRVEAFLEESVSRSLAAVREYLCV